MKKKMLLLLTVVLLTGSLVFAQEIPEGIAAALKKGNAQELSIYLSETVEMNIPNYSSSVPKATSETIMANFFAQNKVSGFAVNHQGKRDESSFIIGTLNTATGNYRVNCYLRKMQNKYLIHQIRIDKVNE